MAQWQATPPGEESRQSPRHTMRRFLIVAAVALVAALVGFFIWGTRQYQALVGLGKQAQEQYGAINRTFTFAPSTPGQAAPAERWQAMLTVRERVLAKLTPQVEDSLQKLLNATPDGKTGVQVDLLRTALPALDSLQGVLDAHLAALRQEKMSLNEYRWLLGLAMTQAMAQPASSPAGAGYWKVLKQAERLTQATETEPNQVSADKVYAQLASEYAGRTLNQPQVLERLTRPGEAAYAIDWLVVASRWSGVEQIKPEKLPRSGPAGG